MDLDNPSYFSVAGETQTLYSGNQRPRKMGNAESASDCSLSRQLTPPKNQNRNVRNFVRSVSSNSADSNQELLIMGEPRLSDIAPDLAFKHPASRSNSLKSRTETHNDCVYNALPTSEEVASELSGDEVFIAEDSARYYNYSVKKNENQRRHSIGTFMGRERTSSVASSSRSFKEDFPQAIVHANSDSAGQNPALIVDDHALRHASYPRKRCPRCTRGAVKKTANMDDILIVSLKSSEAASLWVEYFKSYFQQISKQAGRKPFKIQYIWAEDYLKEFKEDPRGVDERAAGVKLQLVVLCPGLLDFFSEHPEKSTKLGNLFLADKTLALLLGVSDNDLSAVHKKILPTYFQWQRLSVGQDQDENFTKEFLGQAMTILSRVWKQQSSVSQEKPCFSVSPKKIRQGSNSVFISLAYPLQNDDILKVSIERNNELFEVRSLKRRNPYTLKFSIPDNLTEITAIVNILVEKNGSIVGSRPIKCESRLRELEQILHSINNPVEFMCQTLGFSPANKDDLDNWLLQAFKKNVPTHFNLLSNQESPFGAVVFSHQKHSYEEYPTLLHFSAKYGLEKLAMQLLDCPGADIAFKLTNVYGMTPVEMAEVNGFSELANTLRGYMSMHEFTSIYTKLKEISVSSKAADVGCNFTKNLDEYKVCPAPRPVTIAMENLPPLKTNPNGYLTMNSPVKMVENEAGPSSAPTSFNIKNETLIQQSKNAALLEDEVQQQLLEIFNDFKNNVHSISQVEKLVEEWRNRNDVQKSYTEKQEQLTKMRIQYEMIQHEMKAANKKFSPFDKVKKLFAWSKPRDEKHEISTPVLVVPAQRPISSLSTSSSGSSGRMSSISGCSLGDSGTHSDSEERKNNLLSSHNEDEFMIMVKKAAAEANYCSVPLPKPVKLTTFSQRSNHFETIEERPNTLPIAEEHYIQFPPSGLPVLGAEAQSQHGEYMNLGSPNQCGPSPDREYMNFKYMNR